MTDHDLTRPFTLTIFATLFLVTLATGNFLTTILRVNLYLILTLRWASHRIKRWVKGGNITRKSSEKKDNVTIAIVFAIFLRRELSGMIVQLVLISVSI